MVVEHIVYCKKKIVKFFLDINKEYTGISNKYNVRIIIVLSSRFALFW